MLLALVLRESNYACFVHVIVALFEHIVQNHVSSSCERLKEVTCPHIWLYVCLVSIVILRVCKW